jgi:hypothetical protein
LSKRSEWHKTQKAGTPSYGIKHIEKYPFMN